eukprot:6191666-Pleurochrysis_carterae.AAC.2
MKGGRGRLLTSGASLGSMLPALLPRRCVFRRRCWRRRSATSCRRCAWEIASRATRESARLPLCSPTSTSFWGMFWVCEATGVEALLEREGRLAASAG